MSDELDLIVHSCRRLREESENKYTEAEHQQIVEKIVQEKLRQQREACVEAYDVYYRDEDNGKIPCAGICQAILNAKIDES